MSKNVKNQNVQENEVKTEETKVMEQAENPEVPAQPEVKETFIDRQYGKYCAKRKAKAEKKANKKKPSKAGKTGMIVGGALVGGAILAAVGKAILTHGACDSNYELGDGDVRVSDEGTGYETYGNYETANPVNETEKD